MKWRLQWRAYNWPFLQPVRTAHGPWVERQGLVVRLTSPSGKIGYGEVAPVAGFATPDLAWHLARLDGVDEAMEWDRWLEVWPEGPGRFALEAARAAADGGDAPGAKKYLPVAALVPAGRAVLSALRAKAELGFVTFKWKVGVGDLADELSLLDDVVASLPAGGQLRLDANGAWNRRQAERWLERCAERPVEFVEQPVSAEAREAVDLLQGLAEDYPTRLALDESLVTGRDWEQWLGRGWRGVYVVKPSLLGSLEPWLTQTARGPGAVVFSSSLETAVGARAILAAAFQYPGEQLALGMGVWPLFRGSEVNGPTAAPFFRREDWDHLRPEAVWNALS